MATDGGRATALPRDARTASRKGDALVDVRELDVYYGTGHVLRGASFAVAAGEAVGLLGRNGMGKTTLLRAILGLVRARGGAIAIRGRDTATMPAHAIARLGLGYVPEGRGVFADLTVRENLVVAARRGFDGRADWTLARVLATFPRIAARLRHRGDELSGGEQQMLAIGRALMTNPDVLILDEATEGLAPLIVAEIWRVIARIREAGIATLIVDRDWRKVLHHTDRAMVMEKGLITLAGGSAELLAQPEALAQRLGV
jgi:branched-chain amino acid transport system ATP-binding protein